MGNLYQDRLFESDFDKMLNQIETEQKTSAASERGGGKPAKAKKGK